MSSSPTTSESGDTFAGAAWMLLLAILLSWLPIIGPLIAGFVGGRLINSKGKALAIALIPAAAMAVALWLILTLFDLPILGAVAGFGALVVVAIQELPLLAGAWFGGARGNR